MRICTYTCTWIPVCMCIHIYIHYTHNTCAIVNPPTPRSKQCNTDNNLDFAHEVTLWALARQPLCSLCSVFCTPTPPAASCKRQPFSPLLSLTRASDFAVWGLQCRRLKLRMLILPPSPRLLLVSWWRAGGKKGCRMWCCGETRKIFTTTKRARTSSSSRPFRSKISLQRRSCVCACIRRCASLRCHTHTHTHTHTHSQTNLINDSYCHIYRAFLNGKHT